VRGVYTYSKLGRQVYKALGVARSLYNQYHKGSDSLLHQNLNHKHSWYLKVTL